MTNLQEARLAREAEICYVDAGHGDRLRLLASRPRRRDRGPDHRTTWCTQRRHRQGVLRAAVRRLPDGARRLRMRERARARADHRARAGPRRRSSATWRRSSGSTSSKRARSHVDPGRRQRGVRHRGDAVRARGEGARGQRVVLLRGRVLLRAREPGGGGGRRLRREGTWPPSADRPIDLEGLERTAGKTFHWQGKYSYDLNARETVCTDLNVFEFFKPRIPERYRRSEHVFLGNIDPVLQRQVLDQVERPQLVACDTMNFWISGKPEELRSTLAARGHPAHQRRGGAAALRASGTW